MWGGHHSLIESALEVSVFRCRLGCCLHECLNLLRLTVAITRHFIQLSLQLRDLSGSRITIPIKLGNLLCQMLSLTILEDDHLGGYSRLHWMLIQPTLEFGSNSHGILYSLLKCNDLRRLDVPFLNYCLQLFVQLRDFRRSDITIPRHLI